jgi:hypothetical protein
MLGSRWKVRAIGQHRSRTSENSALIYIRPGYWAAVHFARLGDSARLLFLPASRGRNRLRNKGSAAVSAPTIFRLTIFRLTIFRLTIFRSIASSPAILTSAQFPGGGHAAGETGAAASQAPSSASALSRRAESLQSELNKFLPTIRAA